MLLRLSMRRLAGDMHSKNQLSSAAKTYSLPGQFTTYSTRQRYPNLFRQCTDVVVTDILHGKSVKSWCADVPHYNYWYCSVVSFTVSIAFMLRHVYFNPDFMYRREDKRHHMQDRHRLHSYSLPYYNHRLRNISVKYLWMVVDNEHDYGHACPSGIRPHRGHCHRRPLMINVFNYFNYMYPMEDPLFTTNSHENMCEMYHNIGYKKMENMAGDDDDD